MSRDDDSEGEVERDKLSTELVKGDKSTGAGVAPWATLLAGHPGAAILLALPGVTKNLGKAASQIILGLASLGTATLDIARSKLEHFQNRIVQDTAFERAAFDAASENVRRGADPLTERARLQDYFRSRREQQNREVVLTHAVRELTEGQPVETRDEISDDWLAHFSDVASKISEEGVSRFLGRILAGEIASPGTYSVGAIMAIATMSPHTAQLLQDFSDASTHFFPESENGPVCVIATQQDNPEHGGLPELGLPWESLSELAAAGLVNPNFASYLSMSASPRGEATPIKICGIPAEIVTLEETASFELRAVLATRLGRELIKALEPPTTAQREYIVNVAKVLAAQKRELKL